MSLRRRIASTAAATAFLAVATAVGGAPAHGSDTICVALVVDFGDLGGGVDTSCATVHSGATGYDVLQAGGHTFTICSNGVLGSIDGKPSNGCQQKNDSVHYWSYWHRAPGSSNWTYSNEGGGTYQPANRSTEGWRWMKSAPANVPYSQICPQSASPRPAATHTASPKPTTTHPQTITTTSAAAITTTPTSTATRHRQAQNQKARATRTPTPTPTHSEDPSPSATPHVLSADPPSSSSTGGSTGRIALIAAALAVVVALGGAAWWRSRRAGPP